MIIREYYQPTAPDPILAPDQVLGLARQHEPPARAVTGIDESGGEARVYLIDDQLAMKVQRPPQLRSWTSLGKEVEFLQHLARTAPDMSVPRVIGYGREADVEYTLMTRMVGDAVVRTAVPDARRPEMLRTLGRTLRQIHAVPQGPLRDSGLFPEEYIPDDLQTTISQDFSEYAEAMAKHGIAWPWPWTVNELIERAVRNIPRDSPGVAVHSNPGPTHTFVDPETGLFTGLIDFGDAYIGHPADDLVRWPSPEDRRQVLDGYLEAGDPGPAFWGYWPAAEVSADLLYIIRSSQHRGDCIQHVHQIVHDRW